MDELRVLSLSSPKGGLGRTMVAVNIAALYARGCRWAGIPRTTCLVADLDFSAPGVHYFPFLGDAREHPFQAARVGDARLTSWEAVLTSMRQTDIGLMYWLEAMNRSDAFARFLARSRVAAGAVLQAQHAEAREIATEIIAEAATDIGDPRNPLAHAIQILDAADAPVLVLMPPGDPLQHRYATLVSELNPRSLLIDRFGLALLDALYSSFASSADAPNSLGLRVQRIVLDQDAGHSLVGEANWSFAQHHVVVGGFNRQSQEGLRGLLRALNDRLAEPDIHLVLSQYDARQEATAFSSLDPQAPFAFADSRRRELLADIRRDALVCDGHDYLIDFHRLAVQREFFFPLDSPSFEELVRLVATVERRGLPSIALSEWIAPELRILGEFVGTDRQSPSGAIGAFVKWAQNQLTASSKTTVVKGVTARHTDIVDLVEGTNTPLGGDDKTVPQPWMNWPPDAPLLSMDGDAALRSLRPQDFDLIALPFYALHESGRLFADLADVASSQHGAADRVGFIDDEYCRSRILGWNCVSIESHQPHLRGFPLFVDHQLIVASKSNLGEPFAGRYRELEGRTLHGFPEPADVLTIARAATRLQASDSGLLMTLRSGDIAQWYEWHTIVAMFGHDFHLLDAGEHRIPDLHDADLVRATVRYLELAHYADPRSDVFAWNELTRTFFGERKGGLALVWPDAIPHESQPSDHSNSFFDADFAYLPLPGSHRFLECWVLVVPAERRADGPSLQDLRSLLQAFMTYDSQRQYQELGGLSVHRGVLQSVDLWGRFPQLAALYDGSGPALVTPWGDFPLARTFMKRVAVALEALRAWVRERLHKEVEGTGAAGTGESADHLWGAPSFVREVEAQVRKEFDIVDRALHAELGSSHAR